MHRIGILMAFAPDDLEGRARMTAFMQALQQFGWTDGRNGRIDIEADHIGGFRHELGVVALAPGFAGGKVDTVLTQEAPDVLNVHVAQRLGQQRTRPPSIAYRWRLLQKRQDALVRRLP
jgi:hypothetical protein